MHAVELNVDLGENDGEPDELYRLATVVNIACGGHAGDEASMKRALGLAKAAGTAVAVHPSYPDREGFGRSTLLLTPEQLYESLVEQCETLAHLAAAAHVRIAMAKLHGALYHDAANDHVIAAASLDAIVAALPDGPAIVGPPSGIFSEEARARGLSYLREGFADRRYTSEGGLVPRSQPGALLEDPLVCAAQALRLASTGAADTICVHSDTPGARTIAEAVRGALSDARLLAHHP